MANENEPFNTKQDYITLKFGRAEAKIIGFKLAAFTVVIVCVLGWLIF